VVELVVPNLAGDARLSGDAVLAGLVVGQWLGALGGARLANARHLVDGFVVFVGL